MSEIPGLCGSPACLAEYQEAYSGGELDLQIGDVCGPEMQDEWSELVNEEFFSAGVSSPECAEFMDVADQLTDGLWNMRETICE